MTDTPRRWDRLPTETLKAHNAFLSYVALGARRSVREAARQYHVNRGNLKRRAHDGSHLARLVVKTQSG